MPIYDNAFLSNYDEIRTFYPVWYSDVLEMDAIFRAQGKQLDHMQDGIETIISNNYIATADTGTIAALEAFLRIRTDSLKPLEERRAVVASYFLSASSSSHFGKPEIQSIALSFTNGEVAVEFSKGVITVIATRTDTATFNLDDCLDAIKRLMPAHLRLVLIIQSATELLVSPDTAAHPFAYPRAGTLPGVNTVGATGKSIITQDISAKGYLHSYGLPGQYETGTKPQQNVAGAASAEKIRQTVKATHTAFRYPFCGENMCR